MSTAFLAASEIESTPAEKLGFDGRDARTLALDGNDLLGGLPYPKSKIFHDTHEGLPLDPS